MQPSVRMMIATRFINDLIVKLILFSSKQHYLRLIENRPPREELSGQNLDLV